MFYLFVFNLKKISLSRTERKRERKSWMKEERNTIDFIPFYDDLLRHFSFNLYRTDRDSPGESFFFQFCIAGGTERTRPLSVAVRRAVLYIKMLYIKDIRKTTGATATLWDREWRTGGRRRCCSVRAEIRSGRNRNRSVHFVNIFLLDPRYVWYDVIGGLGCGEYRMQGRISNNHQKKERVNARIKDFELLF